MGGNSTLRQHCWKHYKIYKARCEKADIPLNHHTIPPKIVEAQQKAKKAKSQSSLDDIVVVNCAEGFTREGTLHTVAQFVACDDQVSNLYEVQ